MTSTAILGILFLLLGLSAGGLMLRLWGYPYDEEKHVSSAPKSLLLLHRLLGYAFGLIYVVLMFRMVPRLWNYEDEFSTRTAIHAFLGVAIGCVLILKVVILRFLPHFRMYLPALGISIMVMTTGMLFFPLALVVRESRLSARAPQNLALVRERLSDVAAVGPDQAALLAQPRVLESGRAAMLNSCLQCHDVRRIISRSRTASDWNKVVSRMATMASAPERRSIGDVEQHQILAYLVAIASKPAPTVGTTGTALRDAQVASGEPRPTPTPRPTPPGLAPGFAERTPSARRPTPAPTPSAAQSVAATGGARFPAVQAILAANCLECHIGPDAPNGLRLDSFEGILAGAEGEDVVIAGNPDASELIKRIRGESRPAMPMDAPALDVAEVAMLTEWVRELGSVPSGSAGATPAATPGPVDATVGTPGTTPAPPVATPKATEAAASTPAASAPGPNDVVTYPHVRGIFMQNCVRCHSQEGILGAPPEGLILSSLESMLSTPERPVVVPGNPGMSLLLRHVQGTESPRMPHDGPPYLTDEQTRLISRWIRDGARDAEGNPSPIPVGKEVRLRGTMTSNAAIDGGAFVITRGTEVKDAATGATVEMRGVVQGDGTVIAERLRGR